MSSLVQYLMQVAPVLSSAAADDSHSSPAVSTECTVSTGNHTTTMNSTFNTVPETVEDVTSDLDNQYVDAPEQQLQDTEMMNTEETENMEQPGLEDVDTSSAAAFQTPDRKRPFVVDTRTITRAKKTSPSGVSLPEVFAKENKEETQFRPLATAASVMQQQAATTSAAPAATPAAPTTQAAAAPLQDAAKRSAAPAPARGPRQQTMVVSSALSRDLKTAMEQEKASFVDEAAAARLEARLMALVLDKEREWSDKHGKLGQIMVAQKSEADEKLRQSEADIEGLKAALESSIEAMASGFPAAPSSSFGAASSLPHLPPAPVLAAMTSDKLAELARLKKEKENLENENTQLHSQYNSLYETYSQQRTVIPALKTMNEELERVVRAEKERFEKLKRHAEAKLEEASGENESLRKAIQRAEKDYEANTLAIRMRLKQREVEVADLENSMAQKRKQVSDLKEICAELIAKADANGSDIE